MKFKVGDRVFYFWNRYKINRGPVGTVVEIDYDPDNPYVVLWDGEHSPLAPYSDESLCLVHEPNDLLKNLL